MTFLKRCNGSSLPRERLSCAALVAYVKNVAQARSAFYKLAADNYRVDDYRGAFNFQGTDYLLSSRFMDNETVIGRIESAMKDEAEFLAAPYAWCLDALRDCASADYWYTFEKEW